MKQVEELIHRLKTRLGDELGLLEFLVVAGSWVRWSKGLESLKPNDVDLLLIGKDPTCLVTPKLEIARICREVEGVYVFSDFVSQPALEMIAQRACPDPVGIHLMYYPDFDDARCNLPPTLLLSMGREMEVRLGDRARLEGIVLELEAKVSRMPFSERVRLPAFLEQWYSLFVLGNRHIETDRLGREMIFECLKKFARYITKVTLSEILREHGRRPASSSWRDLTSELGRVRSQLRIAAIGEYIVGLQVLFEPHPFAGPADLDKAKDLFIRSLRLYESAMKYYGGLEA